MTAKRGPEAGLPIPPLTDRQRENFWKKVQKTDGCWLWTGAKNHQDYGIFGIQVGEQQRTCRAHRVALALAGVEIPPGMVPDHICKNRLCVRADHMRLTTQRINSTENSASPMAEFARRAVCKYGHPLSGDNVKVEKRGPRVTKTGKKVGRHTTRICLACIKRRQAERARKLSAGG